MFYQQYCSICVGLYAPFDSRVGQLMASIYHNIVDDHIARDEVGHDECNVRND